MNVGDVVYVTDGAASKETTVVALAITEVNPDAGTVSGIADESSKVEAQVWNTDVWRHPPVGGSQTWTVDFSQPGPEQGENATCTLTPGTEGAAWIQDDDGDSTMADWRVPRPIFSAHPDGNWVDGSEWEPGSTVAVTVGSSETTASVDKDGNFGTDQLSVDLQPGDVVRVTDGTTSKETTVLALAIDEVSAADDTVSGTIDSGKPLVVDVYSDTMYWVARFPDTSDGTWTADFAHPGPNPDQEASTWDIRLGTSGGAWSEDEDGDATRIDWYLPNPPVTTATYAPLLPASGWWIDDVTVTLEAESFTGIGVERIDYTITTPGGSPTHYQALSDTIMLPVFTEEGTSTVAYFSVDNNGDVEAERVAYVLIDTNPPDTSSDTTANYANTARITLAPVDTVSGVAWTKYRLDSGPVSSGTVVTTSKRGTHTLSSWSADAAGNVEPAETVSFTVRAPDKGVPSTTLKSTTLKTAWVNNDVSFTLSATDAGWGVAATYYRLTPPGVTASYESEATVSTEGETTLTYWSLDLAGNIEPAHSKTIRIDKTKPVTTSDAVGTYTGTAVINLTPTDNLSGVAQTRHSLDGAKAVTGKRVTIRAKGVHTLAFWSIDHAGNIEDPKTVTFTVK